MTSRIVRSYINDVTYNFLPLLCDAFIIIFLSTPPKSVTSFKDEWSPPHHRWILNTLAFHLILSLKSLKINFNQWQFLWVGQASMALSDRRLSCEELEELWMKLRCDAMTKLLISSLKFEPCVWIKKRLRTSFWLNLIFKDKRQIFVFLVAASCFFSFQTVKRSNLPVKIILND